MCNSSEGCFHSNLWAPGVPWCEVLLQDKTKEKNVTITFITEIQIIKRFTIQIQIILSSGKFWMPALCDLHHNPGPPFPCTLQLYLGLGLWASQIPTLEHDSQTSGVLVYQLSTVRAPSRSLDRNNLIQRPKYKRQMGKTMDATSHPLG